MRKINNNEKNKSLTMIKISNEKSKSLSMRKKNIYIKNEKSKSLSMRKTNPYIQMRSHMHTHTNSDIQSQ